MIKKTFIRIYDTDIGYSFFNSKIAIISASVFFIIFLCSFFAGIVAPYNPFDPASVSLMDAFTPPIWSEGGNTSFFLGTDQQGRDMFSTMIYGSRISLIVGFASIIFAMILGVFLGVTAGYIGGRYEIIVMRITDVQLTIPTILMALLVDGIARANPIVAITKIGLSIFGKICLNIIKILDNPIILEADTYSLFFSTKVDALDTLANCGHSDIPIAKIRTYIAISSCIVWEIIDAKPTISEILEP